MKFSKLIILSLAALSATTVAAAPYRLMEFKQVPAARLNVPALPDSVQTENPFSSSDLLQSRLPLSLLEQKADWTTVLADTAGRVYPKTAATPQVHTYLTRLRANRFAKGKLRISSTSMADVLVNGKSLVKRAAADSVAKKASGSITLNPEADYDIQVNLVTLPDDKGASEFSLEFIPDEEFENVAVVSGPDMLRRFSTRATMTGERIYATSISPDGKYMIVKYSETFSAKETKYRATLQETASGKILTEELSVHANWMPNSNTLYYTSRRNGKYDLITIEVPSLKSKIAAKGIPTNVFNFTPDGKSIIYSKHVDGNVDKGPMKRVQSPDDRIPGNRNRSYLMRYDLDTHAITTLTYGGAATNICDFSRDSKKMLYMSSTMRPEEYPFYFYNIIQFDLEELKGDTIIRNDPWIKTAIYSPDAKQLFLMGGPAAFDGIGANIGNHKYPNDYDDQGYIYDIASGKVRAMTRDFNPTLQDDPFWNAADNKIYFRTYEGFYYTLYSMDPVSGKIEKLPTELQSVYSFSMGDNEATWLSYNGGGYSGTGAAYLLNLKTKKTRLIDFPSQKEYASMELGKTEPWKFMASDGTEIDGYMCLPPEFDPSKKYPLIVYYYGGTTPSTAGVQSPYSPQVFASRDYVVYVINPSGTIGYGQEFSARHVNAWGKRTAEDIIEGVKKFCSDHEFVDSKKVGCLGASYGGFMTQYLQTQTDIFAAAVSHAGISNVTSYWGEGYWGYSYNTVAASESYPWSNPDLFTRQGSLFNADKIHTPLLLLHGTVDTNVPIGESIQLFNALRILGRDVEFITVEDENHIISNFDNKLIWQDTIMAWFAKYLQDAPQWWNELYGK